MYQAPTRSAVVLTCMTCQHTYEPDSDDWRHADTSCPGCGGWTMTADLAEPEGRP
jgi:Zn finger protein HypA/HybF involved in hydrogenase expression